MRLRVYGGYNGSIPDLDFRRYFPRLRRFPVDAIYDLASLDGIGLLSDELEDLLIGWTRSKRFSLRTLAKFSRLRTLYLGGQQKHFEAIGELEALENLTLRSITLPDLFGAGAVAAAGVARHQAGRSARSDAAPKDRGLTYVELWRIRGVEDVSALAEIETLDRFFLQRAAEGSGGLNLEPNAERPSAARRHHRGSNDEGHIELLRQQPDDVPPDRADS